MGTTADDNIDVGIGVHEIAGSSAVVDRVKEKLAAFRAEVAKPVQAAVTDAFTRPFTDGAAAVGEFTLTLETSREIMAQVGGDFEKFRAEVLRLKTAHDQAAVAAIAQATAVAHVATPDAAARVDTLTASIEHLDAVQRRAATIPTASIAGPSQLGPGQFPAVVGPVQLGPEVPERFAETSARAAAFTTEINLAIGALGRMAQAVDVTNRESVAAFTAESQAAAAYLARLGATDDELKIIGTTLTQLERRAGAAAVAPLPGVPVATINSYDRLGGRLRTAANASAILGQTAIVGTGSIAGMSAAAGNLTTGLAAFATGGVGIAVAAAGGLVTIITAIISLTIRWREENEKNRKELIQLSEQQFAGADTRLLRRQSDALTAQIQAAQELRDHLEQQRREQLKGSGLVDVSAEDVDRATENLNNLSQRQNVILGLLVKRAETAGKDVVDLQAKLTADAIRAQTERTRGEFAGRQVAIDQEFAAERKRLQESGADESKIRDAVTALERKHTEDLTTLEQERVTKLTTLRRDAAGQLFVARTEELHGEIAAQRAAIVVELNNKIASITAEVGLESVRGVRIAAAREEAVAKIRKIDDDQARRAVDLEREIEKGVADAQGGGRSELDRAIDAANKRRAERQRAIDKVDLGDAETTANERFNLEVQADEERDAAIAAARKTHGEELTKIAAETENAILELTGKASQARRNVINAEIDDRIKKARELKAPEATITGLERERTVRIGLVGVEDLQTQGAHALDELDAKLKQTEALAVSGAISEREARDRVIDAYSRTRDALAAVVPELLRLAIASENHDAIKNAEDLNTRYLELVNTLHSVSDGFGRLKATGREAAQSALAGLFESATKLGTQDRTEITALSEQLSSARAELEQLLAIPSGKRTAEENQRITELRNEVERTTVSLDNAKSSITTWRDLFVDAAQSIVDALIKVAAQMLATSLLEKALSFSFRVGGGGASADAFSTANLLAPPVGSFAGGGRIGGRGGPTSDANLIAASRDEFVQPAATGYLYGFDVMEGFRRRVFSRDLVRALLVGMSPMQLRPRRSVTHFAEGGLVSPATRTAGDGASAAGQEFTHRLIVEHSPDVVLRVLESPEGTKAMLRTVRQRRRSFTGALSE